MNETHERIQKLVMEILRLAGAEEAVAISLKVTAGEPYIEVETVDITKAYTTIETRHYNLIGLDKEDSE